MLSYTLKLIAHVLQQKLIGETLGSRVKIRAMVSPNSRLMKAVNFYLRQPGLSKAKVCIMCGGPDWPTSVICGFLRLPMTNLLLGLTPMFLMTVPTTLSGAFLNPPLPVYSNILSFLFLVVLFVQVVMGFGVMYYVSRAPADAIAAIPDDQEVKELEVREANVKAVRKEVTSFHALPRSIQAMQSVGTSLLILTFYLLAVFPSSLFQPFGLQDCLNTLGRDPPYDFIRSMSLLGFLAIIALVVGIACMYIFSKWADAQVAGKLGAGGMLAGVKSEGEGNSDELDANPASSAKSDATKQAFRASV